MGVQPRPLGQGEGRPTCHRGAPCGRMEDGRRPEAPGGERAGQGAPRSQRADARTAAWGHPVRLLGLWLRGRGEWGRTRPLLGGWGTKS